MWCLRPPTTSDSPTTPLSTIIVTANIVSRPTVGASPPSITALISMTSMATIENVRISVPYGSPSISREVVGGDDHAERAPQDHAQDPDEQQAADRDAVEVALRQQVVAEEQEDADGGPARREVLHSSSASSMKSQATTSWSPVGSASSPGRATKTVRIPSAAAAARSSLCAATMQASLISSPSAWTLRW